MDDKEIMKQFEESFNIQKEQPIQTYKATSNLNVELDNFNINNGKNIKPNVVNNENLNLNTTNQNIKPNVVNNENNILNSLAQSNNQVMNKPPIQNQAPISTKKRKKTTISISSEVKVAFLLALILFLFILVMPSIADFFRNIKLRFR